jgi:hypothetical protein
MATWLGPRRSFGFPRRPPSGGMYVAQYRAARSPMKPITCLGIDELSLKKRHRQFACAQQRVLDRPRRGPGAHAIVSTNTAVRIVQSTPFTACLLAADVCFDASPLHPTCPPCASRRQTPRSDQKLSSTIVPVIAPPWHSCQTVQLRRLRRHCEEAESTRSPDAHLFFRPAHFPLTAD